MKKLILAAFCFVLAMIFSSCNTYINCNVNSSKNEYKEKSETTNNNDNNKTEVKDTIQQENTRWIFDFTK